MKKQITFLKAGLVALFLFVTVGAFAQTFQSPIAVTADLDVGAKPEPGNTVPAGATVLFYNPATAGPTFSLKPSPADADGIVFTSYVWAKVKSDNSTYGEKTILASVNEGTYVIGASGEEGALAPGYHVFRVSGYAGSSASSCLSDEYQEYVVYVLPPLTVSAGLAATSSSLLEYCEADLPTGSNAIILSNTDNQFKIAPVSGETGTYKGVNNDFASPLASNFEYKYQWYSIKKGATPAEDVRTLITGATSKDYTVDLAPGVAGYGNHGTYTFEVVVEYLVKDKDGRSYVSYIGKAKDGSGNDIEINITPKPGKPTITIGAVID